MRGGQVKVLSDQDRRRLLKVAKASRYSLRNVVIVLLSIRAGLRAGEIAHLDWKMVTDGRGHVTNLIILPARVTKYGLARRIPVHSDLKLALIAHGRQNGRIGPVAASERRGGG